MGNQITLTAPMIISARLLPAVRMGDSTVSIEAISHDPDGRINWQFFIDKPNEHGLTYRGEGLSTHHGVRESMGDLLSFLQHFGESARRWEIDGDDDGDDLPVPTHVARWCEAHQDEMSMIRLEIEEPEADEEREDQS